MESSISQTFAVLTLCVSTVLVVVLVAALIKSKASRISMAFLILLMTGQLYSQILIVLVLTIQNLKQLPTFLYRSSYPLELSSPPLIFLYVLSLTQSHFRWKDIHWYHGLPFCIGVGWFLFGRPFSLSEWALDKYLRTFLSFFVMLPYAWKTQRVISKLQIELKNQRSSLVELRLPWLRFLLGVCYLGMLLTFFDLLVGPEVSLWIYRGGIATMALMGLTYYGLKTSCLFDQIDQNSKKPSPETGHSPTEEIVLLRALLLKLLREGFLYLKPQIRLGDIANEMGIKSYKLSEVIHQGLHTNFYDLINGLRVEHAMSLMRDPTKQHLNLLGIALESGFNSKSVFNECFRRKIGMTPSEFRQKKILVPSEIFNSDNRFG